MAYTLINVVQTFQILYEKHITYATAYIPHALFRAK